MASEHVSLRVLSLVNEERNGYGLRSNEYARYHAHCTHKVQRLRQKLKLTHGKGREYKKTQPVAEVNLTDAHLQLSLFEAERAWTHSHELSSQPNASSDATLRHSATSRFRRAVTHSTTLLSQASSLLSPSSSPPRISTTSFLEITAYALTLSGRFFLRRDDFDPALDRLAVARLILTTLAQGAGTSRDEALYTLFGDEIAPQIRFAAHSLGRKAAYDIEGVVKDVATPKVREELVPGGWESALVKFKEEREKAKGEGSKSGSGAVLRDVVWEGKPVPIRNPELVDAFLKVQNAEDAMLSGAGSKRKGKTGGDAAPAKVNAPQPPKTMRSKIAAFDGVLLALTDAEQVAQKLVESKDLISGGDAHTTSSGGAAGDRDIHFVLAYTSYRLLARRIERDLLLVDSLLSPSSTSSSPSAPQSQQGNAPSLQAQQGKGKGKEAAVSDPRINPGLVKLYDTILQSLEQMRNLSIVDESIDLVPSVESRLAFSRAKRVLYLSRTYGTLKRYAEALALTSKAHIYLRESASILSSSFSESQSKPEEAYYTLTPERIAEAETELEKEETKMKMEWYAFNGGLPTANASKDGQGHKKPMFYDVAFNYVELPMDRLFARSKAGKAQAAASAASVAATSKAQAASKPMAPHVSTGAGVGVIGEGRKEKRSTKVEAERPPSPEVKIVQSGGLGLGGILGGWWGRK